MNDTFSLLQKYTGISKYSKSEVITPQWVVSDMVDLLPQEVFNPDATFFDPAVKSGRFLIEIYHRLMNSKQMKQAFPNEQDRHKHIIENQLYGFATSPTAATVVRKALYDDPLSTGNIRFTSDRMTNERVQGAFSNMRFDVVIGNPPYNKGMDLDFVNKGFEMSKQYTVMITPAKWQTAEADQRVMSEMTYGEFRKKIVPHMSHVVYFPNSLDVFDDVYQIDGITYFCITHETHSKCIVVNKQCDIYEHAGKINDILMKCEGESFIDRCIAERDIRNGESLLNIGQEVIDSLGKYDMLKPDYYKSNTSGKHKVWINNLVPGNQQVSAGGFLGIGKAYIRSTKPDKNQVGCYFASDSIDECKSYLSYLNSKLVRFLLSCNYSKLTGVICDYCFRFVPAPPSGKFDHIYTDDELYKDFNLPQKYIDVIEAVVKERK